MCRNSDQPLPARGLNPEGYLLRAPHASPTSQPPRWWPEFQTWVAKERGVKRKLHDISRFRHRPIAVLACLGRRCRIRLCGACKEGHTTIYAASPSVLPRVWD